MTHQELLAKARGKLSSLQMMDIEEMIKEHGNLTGVAYRYQKVAIYFEDDTLKIFKMWD